jgi:hypothetical protein
MASSQSPGRTSGLAISWLAEACLLFEIVLPTHHFDPAPSLCNLVLTIYNYMLLNGLLNVQLLEIFCLFSILIQKLFILKPQYGSGEVP